MPSFRALGCSSVDVVAVFDVGTVWGELYVFFLQIPNAGGRSAASGSRIEQYLTKIVWPYLCLFEHIACQRLSRSL